jgi:hypothetical protein
MQPSYKVRVAQGHVCGEQKILSLDISWSSGNFRRNELQSERHFAELLFCTD